LPKLFRYEYLADKDFTVPFIGKFIILIPEIGTRKIIIAKMQEKNLQPEEK
jgi:hypothetical protein